VIHYLTKDFPILLDPNGQFLDFFNKIYDEYLVVVAKLTIDKCKSHVSDIATPHRWNLPQELRTLTGEWMEEREKGEKQRKEEEDRIYLLGQIKDSLKEAMPQGVPNDLPEKIYRAATKKTALTHIDKFFGITPKMEGFEMSDSTQQQIITHINDQFEALKALLTLLIILALETNITNVLDSREFRDKNLFFYLNDKIQDELFNQTTPTRLDIQSMKEDLKIKAEETKRTAEFLNELTKIASQTLNEIKDFNGAFRIKDSNSNTYSN